MQTELKEILRIILKFKEILSIILNRKQITFVCKYSLNLMKTSKSAMIGQAQLYDTLHHKDSLRALYENHQTYF